MSEVYTPDNLIAIIVFPLTTGGLLTLKADPILKEVAVLGPKGWWVGHFSFIPLSGFDWEPSSPGIFFRGFVPPGRPSEGGVLEGGFNLNFSPLGGPIPGGRRLKDGAG